ncbi:MAG: hypothetical protein JST36_08220 [Bacteroidetes bacterium]|nr:hypothetical protein [Bacteroidota bacterium]
MIAHNLISLYRQVVLNTMVETRMKTLRYLKSSALAFTLRTSFAGLGLEHKLRNLWHRRDGTLCTSVGSNCGHGII